MDPDSGFRTYTGSCDRISSVVCISICLYVCSSDRCVVGRAVRGPVSATVRAVRTNVDVCFNQMDTRIYKVLNQETQHKKKHTADVGLAERSPSLTPRERDELQHLDVPRSSRSESSQGPRHTPRSFTHHKNDPRLPQVPRRSATCAAAVCPQARASAPEPQPRCPSSQCALTPACNSLPPS